MGPMEIILRIILPALIPLALGVLLSGIEKRNAKGLLHSLTKDHILIRLPRAYLWVGCLEASLFTGFLVWMACFPNGTGSSWVFVLFSLGALSGIGIMVITMVWKIEIFRQEDYFLLRTVTLKTHKIPYCQCLSFQLKTNSLTLKTSQGTFSVDCYATNFEILIAMLTQHKVKRIS